MQANFLLPQQTKEARNIGQSDIQRTRSEQKRGRTLSPETRAKISAATKGKLHSPETRARISEALQRRRSERRKQQTEQLARRRKTALPLHPTPAERQTLHAWQRATTISAGRARRGWIILLLADGMTITAITKTVGVSRRSVYRWVQRFLEQGVEGLADKPGRGAAAVGRDRLP